MPIYNGLDKLSDTVATLAVETGDLRSRLKEAMHYFEPINPTDDLPPDLAVTYASIMDDLDKGVPAQVQTGRVWAAIDSKDDDELERIVRNIVSLYEEIARRVGQTDYSRGNQEEMV